MDADIQAMDGNQTTVQVLDSGNLPSHSFPSVDTRASVVSHSLPSLDAGFRQPCRKDGPPTDENSSMGKRSLKLLLPEERSTNKQELDRQGFPSWSLGTSQTLAQATSFTGSQAPAWEPSLCNSNSQFGSKPRHFGRDAEIQAKDGNKPTDSSPS